MTQSRRLFRVPTILVLAVLMACPFAGQAQESVQEQGEKFNTLLYYCLLYTSPSPRDP